MGDYDEGLDLGLQDLYARNLVYAWTAHFEALHLAGYSPKFVGPPDRDILGGTPPACNSGIIGI